MQKNRRASEARELEILPLALQRVTNRRVAIDGGANVGRWAIAMAPYFDAVFAFEPVDFSYQAMQQNLEASRCNNVYPIQTALLDHECTVQMKSPPKRSASTAFYAQRSASGQRAIRIDIMNLEDCGLIKLDLEGAELRALYGAVRTLERCKPVLIVEVVPRQLVRFLDSAERLHAFLLKRGYKMHRTEEPNRIYLPC